MKIRLFEDGNFARWIRTSLLAVGILIMVVAYEYVPPAPFGGFLLLLGFGIAAIGGYASRAHLLKIKPFDNSYEKARKTYGARGEEQDKT
ncbi:hypothetical protein KZJ38_18390 [Paraburkholderia edwinii]|uniref:DUF202 domain-containing protein n=1 Tax=Paraburkholderia edwinii TaxID=2861782 RepID=A0ABX8UH88_9BURK|nr:hypothetical protein [Paraburkholderia edwinii]QYD68219.1 hypothetical protein KZJ38_18390 [Paraburkholderia edwinii]